MIYLEDGSVIPVEKNELPIELPEDIDLNYKGNPLDNFVLNAIIYNLFQILYRFH